VLSKNEDNILLNLRRHPI